MKVLILKEILKHTDIYGYYGYIDVLDEEELYIISEIEAGEELPEFFEKYPKIVVQDYCNAYKLWGYNNRLRITTKSVLQDDFDINAWFQDQEELFLVKKLDELL